MWKLVLDVDRMAECMALIVRGEVGAREHCAHHVGEGAVRPFSNCVLKRGAGARGL